MKNAVLAVAAVLFSAPPAAAQTVARSQNAPSGSGVVGSIPALGGPLGAQSVFPTGLLNGPSGLAPSRVPIVGPRAAALAAPVVSARAAAPVLSAPEPESESPLDGLRQAAAIGEQSSPKEGATAPADNGRRVFDGSRPMSRPLVEGWLVEGKSYSSTAELVKALPDSARPLDAAYSFAHSAEVPPRARGANTAVGAVSGGMIGAGVGALFTLLGGIIGPVLDLMMGGRGSGPEFSQFLIFTGVFGGGGAFMGSMIGLEESAKPEIEKTCILGKLYRHAGPEGSKLYFEAADGGKQTVVDLEAYAAAVPLPAPVLPAPWPAWKRAAAGFAAGAALAVSQWIPLVQAFTLPVAGPAVGAEVGKALSAGTGVAGGVLGGSLGLLVPAAAFVSFAAVQSVGILAAFGAFGGALALIGAVVGLWAADAMRAQAAVDEARNPAGQWWSRETSARRQSL